MNSRQIECFLEAGRLLNFTRAAETLTLPQPAVSRYISSLEEELGVKLFIRESNRRVQLSEAGKIYYGIFQHYSTELARARSLLSKETPVLRLGYNTGWNLSNVLPPTVQRCRKELPGFRLQLECLDFPDLVRALHEKRLDAIISTESYLLRETNLEVDRLTSIGRCIVFSEQLEGSENIHGPADFHPYDFYLLDDSRVRQLVQETESFFHAYHFTPRIVTVRNLDTVFASVENGLGVALLDEWYINLPNSRLRAVWLDDRLDIAMASRRNRHHPALDLLREAIREQFFENTVEGPRSL